MNREEILKEVQNLEENLNELTAKLTEEEIKNSTKEEKIEYLKVISEIKSKIEILKNI